MIKFKYPKVLNQKRELKNNFWKINQLIKVKLIKMNKIIKKLKIKTLRLRNQMMEH